MNGTSHLDEVTSSFHPSQNKGPTSESYQLVSDSYQPVSESYQPVSGSYQPVSGSYHPITGSYQRISVNLYHFLHQAWLGPVGSSRNLVWSDYHLNQSTIDPSSSLQSWLSVDRWIYRRMTLYQLLELYAMHNQGRGIGIRRKSGWLQADPVMGYYFPEVAFPMKTREFILSQIQPLPPNLWQAPSSKAELESDQLIQQAYDHFKYYYAG